MGPVRILHLADCHLDTPFYGRDEVMRRRLRDACREAFQAGVELAVERRAHAVLIAGDLFDDDRLSFPTERLLLDCCRRLDEAGIPLFYAPGNHDPGRANYRARSIDWPPNVHMFASSNPETVDIRDPDGQAVARLTGAGHMTPAESQNMAADFPVAEGELPHIGLLHTQVTGARSTDRHERYAPCTEDDLRNAGYDYWALGHIHLRQRVCEEAPAWYAGNTQGRNPRETGSKGALWVEVEKGMPAAPEFVPLAPVVWHAEEVACPAEAEGLGPLTLQLVTTVRERMAIDDGREHFVRVDLTGQSPLAAELAQPENLSTLTEELQEALGAGWLEVRPADVTRPVDLEEYRDGRTVLGTALELIDKAASDDELIEELCPEELAGNPDDATAYLRELLDGLDREAAARLVPEEER